ncbi:MAG: choice-of-anchor I family protein [Chitinophagales bacterium]|nr:choice-of-anchor I family protein [Chitinophagales bacterium]
MTYKYSFTFSMCMLLTLFSWGQQEFSQGFEGAVQDNWNFTPVPAAYDLNDNTWGVASITSEIVPATGGNFWYMHNLDNSNGGIDGFHTLDFDEVDVSGYPHNILVFKYYTVAYEQDDSIGYILEFDTDTGFDMANYVDLNRNTEAWTTVFVNIPSGTSTVRLRLMTKQNSDLAYAGFDDIVLSSSDFDFFAPSVLSAELMDASTIRVYYNESMNEASVENPNNYTIGAIIDNITYTEPGDNTYYVDIAFASPFTNGTFYSLVVGQVADVAGNVYIGGHTYDFVYNDGQPQLVITEIMYNNPGSDDYEFVEIYNADEATVALAGLTFNGPDVFALPAIDLAPGEFLLLAADETAAETFYGMDFYGWGGTSLPNNTSSLSITNVFDYVIDEVTYDDDTPWPLEANGGGPSLELIAPELDNSLAANWRANSNQFEETEIFANPGSLSEVAPPLISFVEKNVQLNEASGIYNISLSINNPSDMEVSAIITVVSASTAVNGVDYTLASTSIDFAANDTSDQSIELNILDNDVLGGRYLILEIDQEQSTVGVGENARFILLIQDNDDLAPAAAIDPYVQLNHLSSFDLGGDKIAEIIAHDGASHRLFSSSAELNTLEIVSYADPANLSLVNTIDLSSYGGGVNSVAVQNGIVAVAVEGNNVDDNGVVAFFDTDGTFLNSVPTGVLPDMVVFTPDGSKLLTANEGEPDDDYIVDPEGSITIIDISDGIAAATANTIGFQNFNNQQAELEAQGIRIFGPGATVAQDLEPESIAISDDGTFAYVTCQENNAVAVIDINQEAVNNLVPLGFKDWTANGVTMDASNSSGDIFFANWPVRGIYQPDAISYFNADGVGYLITANEGDARDYDGYREEYSVQDDEIILDETAFPNAAYLKEEALLGSLKVTNANGDTDGDGDLDEIYVYGGRSFSIWNATTGELVYDSGNDLEQITAADPVFGALFNSDNEENDFKNRSGDKGPEPETVITAEIDGSQFAFISLERIGGVMVYNVTDPTAPQYVQYINTRTVDALGGDLSPEGLNFIPAEDSPNGKPMLSVAYEVSGSIALFELELNCPIISIPANLALCESDAIILEVSGQYADIEWSTGDSTTTITVTDAGTYTVVATTAAGCTASDTSEVTILPLPVIELGENVVACEGETVSLEAEDGFELYEWSNGEEISTIEVSDPATYSITVVDSNGCEAFDEVGVSFNPLPEINFPLDTMLCVENPFIFDPGMGNSFIINGEVVESFSTEGLEVGSYDLPVTVINDFDCTIEVNLAFTIDVCAGVNDQTLSAIVDLYPNPTSGISTIRISELEISAFTLDMINATGEVLERYQVDQAMSEFQQELKLTDKPAGLYFIRIYSQEGTLVRRLIVE